MSAPPDSAEGAAGSLVAFPRLVAATPPQPSSSPEQASDPAEMESAVRLAEALIYASDRPVAASRLQLLLGASADAEEVLRALEERCRDRPVRLVEVAGGFAFRTAPDLAPTLTKVVEVPRRLPRAAMETLAIVAWHQPVTRAEIEAIRGAAVAQPTLDALLERALVTTRGHKEVPGRPALWVTTPRFLEQFGLRSLRDLPRREELVAEPVRAAPESPAAGA